MVFFAIVPAQNEAHNLKKIIPKLLGLNLDVITPILNGCHDESLSVLETLACPRLAPLCFTEPLGIDVPRAIGVVYARKHPVEGILFLDGDMVGVSRGLLQQLIDTIKKGYDLALTDCYPARQYFPPGIIAAGLIKKRIYLNRRLGFFAHIGSATPSHGPHAVSAALLQHTCPRDFVIPPMLLVQAARAGLRVTIGAETPHLALGSAWRGGDHALKIYETIMGDYVLALHNRHLIHGSRSAAGQKYEGYHRHRRFDLLHLFTQGHIHGKC